MKFRMRACVAIATVLVAASAPAANRTPEATTRQFFSWAVGVYHGGLPDAKTLAPVHGLVSRDLGDLFVRAQATERACFRWNREAEARSGLTLKPAIIEGNLVGGYDEDPTQVLAFLPEPSSKGKARVRVRLRYVSRIRTWDPPFDWEVVAELESQAGAWVIDDIRYDREGSMAAWLQDYAANSCGR